VVRIAAFGYSLSINSSNNNFADLCILYLPLIPIPIFANLFPFGKIHRYPPGA
jgi:hypothetical protein